MIFILFQECYLTKMMLPDMTIAFRAGCKAEKVNIEMMEKLQKRVYCCYQ